jgi:anti-sigma B factor antagonist
LDTTAFTIAIDQCELGTAVRPSGELDAASAGLLRMAFASVLAGPVAVDLSRVKFMDSAGLGVLLWGVRRVRALGDVELHDPNLKVLHLLRITGVDRVFPVVIDGAQWSNGVTAD